MASTLQWLGDNHTVAAARPVLANVVKLCSWADQYNTWLLIKLTPEGVVFIVFSEAVLCMQTVQTFEAALEALVAAGVELVEFDMGLLTAEGAEIEAELLLAYEMPREVSRSVHLLHCRFKLGPF